MYLPGISEVLFIVEYYSGLQLVNLIILGVLANFLKLLKNQIAFVFNKRIKKNLAQSFLEKGKIYRTNKNCLIVTQGFFLI